MCKCQKNNKLINTAMLEASNYLSPLCTYIEVCNEGVLCASVDKVDANGMEKFDSFNEFEW